MKPQRAGRVGRVAPGTVFRLYSRQAAASMEAAAEPEMKRYNLEALALQAASFATNRSVASVSHDYSIYYYYHCHHYVLL